MLYKMLRYASPVRSRNLLFVPAVTCLAVFVTACAPLPSINSSSVVLREAEHKTVKHPEKKVYATILPDGLRVSFTTKEGRLAAPYTFEHEQFPVGERVFLSCHASTDLLPMRVARLKEVGDYVDYEIEWLTEPPTKSDGTRKVARCR